MRNTANAWQRISGCKSHRECGCIVSFFQGRVRICETHRPEKASGDGGEIQGKLPKVVRQYPANGIQVNNWKGR